MTAPESVAPTSNQVALEDSIKSDILSESKRKQQSKNVTDRDNSYQDPSGGLVDSSAKIEDSVSSGGRAMRRVRGHQGS